MLEKSRTRWTLAAGVALVLCLLLVPAVWAAITVNGDCTDSDWSGHLDLEDPRDTVDPQTDAYDIQWVYSTTESDGDLFIRYNTYGNIVVNESAFTEVWFDTDNNPGSGHYDEDEHGTVGAEYRMKWYMTADPPFSDACYLYEWTDPTWTQLCTGDSCCNGEWGTSSTCVEIFVSGQQLGLYAAELPVHLYFDNAATPSDDHVQWDYDIPTAVELSAFTACSERGRPSEPWFTWLWPVGLVSGLVAVSAGGFVLWRRKGLA
ncbi:MAG: hypothetical protein WBB22_09415, partial [Anaerolineae bacterium]